MSTEELIPKNHPIRPIRAVVDAVLSELDPLFDRNVCGRGPVVGAAGGAVEAGGVDGDVLDEGALEMSIRQGFHVVDDRGPGALVPRAADRSSARRARGPAPEVAGVTLLRRYESS